MELPRRQQAHMGESVNLRVRLSARLVQDLDYLAAQRNLSRSAIIAELLTEGVKRAAVRTTAAPGSTA